MAQNLNPMLDTSHRGRAKKIKDEMLVNVKLTEDDEIEVQEVEHSYDGSSDEELRDPDAEPELYETEDGRLVIDIKATRTCPECKKSFNSAAELTAHKAVCTRVVDEIQDIIQKEKKAAKHAQPGEEFQKYCNPNPEHPCYCCGEDISTAHVGHIRCKYCPKSFKAYEYFNQHIRSIHAETEEFACTQCNAKCSSKTVLKEHYTTHAEGKPFSCIRCGKDFTRKYHLDRHGKHSNCGDEPKDSLPCEVCGKIFTRMDNLREHLRSHMGQGVRKRDYQCPYCPKSFYGSSLLNIHIRTHTGERPFPCDLCPKSFPSTGALRKHRRKHTGERPYRCDQCSATFAARETLNRHRKTHTGEKPHACNECGKRFIQATQLRSHMFNHTGENGYKCGECNASFNRKSRLTEHIRFIHNGETPMECDYCHKKFTRKEDMARHMQTHIAVKVHACPTCDKRFNTKPALNVHLKTHVTEDPVYCKICSRKFIRMDCLLRHMKSKHEQNLKEILDDTAKRKAKLMAEETTTTSTVEINGEIFQITPMDEQKIVNNIVPPGSPNFQVLQIVDLPPVQLDQAVTEDIEPMNKVEYQTNGYGEVEMENTADEGQQIELIPMEVDEVTIKEETLQKPTRTPKQPKEKKPRQRRQPKIQLLDEDTMPIFLSDDMLKEKIAELLQLLIEVDVLEEFGWPNLPVEELLSKVIKRCGHRPARDDDDGGDYTTRMRENAKILFSLTMDDDNIKSLLNNHTVDEVIMNVLKSK